MYKLTQGEFIRAVNKAKTEEDVKYAYAHNFNIKFDTSEHLDLYTPQILFEFKKEKKFSSKNILANILSQSLYYIHKLKYGLTDKIIPRIICLADKHQVLFTETYLWKEFYTDSAKKYDWDLPPSSPDISLVRDIYSTDELRNIHIYQLELEHEFKLFHEKLVYHLNPQRRIEFGDKKLITEENFEDVYKYWEHEFGESVYNGLKPSKYFVSDIQPNNTIVRESEGVILFRTETNEYKKKKILPEDYNHFWSLYEKVSNPATLRGIIAKIDRLNDEFSRRFHGEFFTPLNFANKGLEYVEKTLGIDWWKNQYRIWDMAAGTGNLQYYLPNDAYQFCYLSTLYHEDVEHLNRLFPSATSFQYDYLNDDIDLVFKSGKLQFLSTWKLPENYVKI